MTHKKRVPLARFFGVFLGKKSYRFMAKSRTRCPESVVIYSTNCVWLKNAQKSRPEKKAKKRLKKGTPKWAPKPPEFEFGWGKTIGFFETRFFDQKKTHFFWTPFWTPPWPENLVFYNVFERFLRAKKVQKWPLTASLNHRKWSWRARVESKYFKIGVRA